jgi:uncharacterized protein YigE (DUF2233 family)
MRYFTIAILLALALSRCSAHTNYEDAFISYEADVKSQALKMYWRDENDQPFKSIGRLNAWLQLRGEQLQFAMNGGMYNADHVPVGLFVQAQKTLTPLDTTTKAGNFYLKPNGVFYTTADGRAVVCKTEAFTHSPHIAFATQSGPMLLVDGQLHPAFTKGSANRNIRNGVGMLPNGHVLFAMSKKEISFYDFAEYFRRRGCRNALYLDGLVSRTYLPEKNWVQTDGDFGVIIGVVEKR